MIATQELIEKYRHHTIKTELLDWASTGCGSENDKDVIERLQEVNCAACCGPAPIYNDDMAQCIAANWAEIQEALDAFYDTTGLSYAIKSSESFLNVVWFAYEWFASELATELDTSEFNNE